MRRTWCSAREQRRIQDDCGHARQCTEAAARPLSAMQRKRAQHDDVSTSTEGATAREERSQLGRRRCRRAHEAAGRRSRQRAGRQVCAGGVPLGADGRVCACLLLRRHNIGRVGKACNPTSQQFKTTSPGETAAQERPRTQTSPRPTAAQARPQKPRTQQLPTTPTQPLARPPLHSSPQPTRSLSPPIKPGSCPLPSACRTRPSFFADRHVTIVSLVALSLPT